MAWLNNLRPKRYNGSVEWNLSWVKCVRACVRACLLHKALPYKRDWTLAFLCDLLGYVG